MTTATKYTMTNTTNFSYLNSTLIESAFFDSSENHLDLLYQFMRYNDWDSIILPLTYYVGILSGLGTLGNILVIVVYACNFKNSGKIQINQFIYRVFKHFLQKLIMYKIDT